jgi:hypothetical protein
MLKGIALFAGGAVVGTAGFIAFVWLNRDRIMIRIQELEMAAMTQEQTKEQEARAGRIAYGDPKAAS